MSNNRAKKYSPEVKQRAVRMYGEQRAQYGSDWSAMESIATKIGCATQTLQDWVRQSERDSGKREGLTTEERAQMKALEREVKELRRANEILRLASAFFAKAEIERQIK
jgi:transposase